MLKDEKMNNKNLILPPIGITPKRIWIIKRTWELKEAIQRYEEFYGSSPDEWIKEYNNLKKILKRVKL